VQDFDLGETYEQKVVLMNSTHAMTYCKLVGISDELKDFITLSYVRITASLPLGQALLKCCFCLTHR